MMKEYPKRSRGDNRDETERLTLSFCIKQGEDKRIIFRISEALLRRCKLRCGDFVLPSFDLEYSTGRLLLDEEGGRKIQNKSSDYGTVECTWEERIGPEYFDGPPKELRITKVEDGAIYFVIPEVCG